MILFQSIIQITAGAMAYRPAQLAADRTRVAVVAVGRNPIWGDAGHALGGAEERPGGLHVPMLAEHHVDQRAGAVDGTIQVAPATADLDVSLVRPTLPRRRRRRSSAKAGV